jgi:hypothetical protein
VPGRPAQIEDAGAPHSNLDPHCRLKEPCKASWTLSSAPGPRAGGDAEVAVQGLIAGGGAVRAGFHGDAGPNAGRQDCATVGRACSASHSTHDG